MAIHHALASIYDSYAKDIYRNCYSSVGNLVDAEDLTAQIFTELIESLPCYRHSGIFIDWIFQIAYDKIMDFFREYKLDPIDIPINVAYSNDVLERIIKGQTYERFFKLLKTLKEDERQLIRLPK